MYFDSKTLVQIAIEVFVTITLLSALITTLNEIITGILNWRGYRLKWTIRRALGKKLADEFYQHDIVAKLREYKFRFFAPIALTKETFSKVLTDVLIPHDVADYAAAQKKAEAKLAEAGTDESTANILTTFLHRSSSLEDLNTRLKYWFDESGKKSTSIYSRDMKVLGFALSFVLVAACDFDSVRYLKSSIYGLPEPKQAETWDNYFDQKHRKQLAVLTFELSTEETISFTDKSNMVLARINVAAKRFEELSLATGLCSLENSSNFHTSYKASIKAVHDEILQLRTEFVTTASSAYPNLVITKLKSMLPAKDGEEPVTCDKLAALEGEVIRHAKFFSWVNTGSRWYGVFNLVFLSLVLSLGSETWFKFIDRLVLLKSKL